MKKGLTEIVFIIDRSGSMHHLTDDTVGGFNAMIEKQKKLEGECLVNAVLFNNTSTVLYDRVPLNEVEPMTEEQYSANGSTALLDALGGAIHHIANIHKYAREEDVPEKTLFVITTDGMENASHFYSLPEVKAMVKKEQEKYGWEFIFLGANIDAVGTAASYGIRADRAVNYRANDRGTRAVYESVGRAVTSCRRDATVCGKWAAPVEMDNEDIPF